jgi:3-deoxy-D-manno-octulosonic-acid transferase
LLLLYSIAVQIYTLGISVSAFAGNSKAKKWIEGRKNWKAVVREKMSGAGKRRAWFHCASLGEFEQGRPLIEKIKKEDPSIFVILTFFSPSGYEVRKNYPSADCICYLPPDTGGNAKAFFDLVNPAYVVFIKYEFWFRYFKEAHKRNIPLYMASALFRKSQVFFKWYGGFFRSVLKCVTFFFVQDENSAALLNNYGIRNCSVTGDTRFDRVHEIAAEGKQIDLLEELCRNKKVIVAGSTWPEDEKLLLQSLDENLRNEIVLLIAPHEIDTARISWLITQATTYYGTGAVSRFSQTRQPAGTQLLIIDNMGMLSGIYRYASIAWIGGGFGKGIHNILEAAAYGKPVIFGPNYSKFREAVQLTEAGGAFPVKDVGDASKILNKLMHDHNFLSESSDKCRQYVNSHLGATEKIISYIEKRVPVD